MNRLTLARIVACLVFGVSLSSFAQSKGIDSLPAEDQEIAKALEFKTLTPAPLAERRWTYIKGEIVLVNNSPRNSITDKLHAQMSMLFVNKDQEWVVVNCGDVPFAVTTKGPETVHVACKGENKTFEKFLGDKKAPPLTTRTIVRYGDVVIYEEPLSPVAASAPAEWWTKPTGILGKADDAAVAAQNAVSGSAPPTTPNVAGASAKSGKSNNMPATIPAVAPAPTPTGNGPATVPAPSTAPATPDTTTPAIANTPTAASAGLVLDRNWASPMQGGKAAMQELGALLSPFAQPSPDMAPSPGLKLFEEVTYLMPYAEARKKLNLNQRLVPKAKVECAGFPKDSFYSYAFDGVFEGHFNKLYLVTDKADQVVAVQLVTGNPNRTDVDAPYYPTDGHTYNFINSRAKATTRLWVDHKPFFQGKDGWRKYDPKSGGTSGQPSGEVGLLRIDSLLMDPKPDSTRNVRGSNWKALEAVRLYLPKPMMEIILHCIRGANR